MYTHGIMLGRRVNDEISSISTLCLDPELVSELQSRLGIQHSTLKDPSCLSSKITVTPVQPKANVTKKLTTVEVKLERLNASNLPSPCIETSAINIVEDNMDEEYQGDHY